MKKIFLFLTTFTLSISLAFGADIFNLTDSWTDSGTTYDAIKMVVTDTDSAADSKLLNITASTGGVFQVSKGGALTLSSTVDGRDIAADGALLDTALQADGSVATTSYQPFTPVSAPAHTEGRLFYDTDEKALTYYNDSSAVAVNLAQESILRSRNVTGSLIEDGSVVYISGSTGEVPQVTKALAGATTPSIIGIATEDIADNSFGYVTTFGIVRGIDTTGFTAGDTVYLSTSVAGEFTATKPTLPDEAVQVGVIIKVAAAGKLFVTIEPMYLNELVDDPTPTLGGTLTLPNGGTIADSATKALIFTAPTDTETSGTRIKFEVASTYNQVSGTAANTDVLIDRTVAAVGSGLQLYLGMGTAGAMDAYFDAAGQLTLDVQGDFGVGTGLAFGDGDFNIYENSDDILVIGTPTASFAFLASGMQVFSASGAQIKNTVATNTNPVFIPNQADIDTGIGSTTDALSLIAGGVEGIRIVEDTWGASSHFDELSATPTPIADKWSIYFKTDDILYVQDGAGAEHLIHGKPSFKSYTFVARDAASGENFQAGFYDYATADANLTDASLTVTQGGANAPYAAHAFIVSGGNGTTDGSDLVLTVSGTSINDDGTRSAADSEVIEATAEVSAVNTYFETTKKWIGQITYTLSSTAGGTFSYDFNYGFAKYEDMGNRDYIITDFESVGLANANDSGFNIELLHHNSTGWTYAASGFVAGNTPLASMNTIHSTEQDLDAGEQFAFKRSGMSTAVDGDGGEGILVRITTGANNSVSYMDTHVGVTF